MAPRQSSSDDSRARLLNLEHTVTTLVTKVDVLVERINELKTQMSERVNVERATSAARADVADVAARAERASTADRAVIAERAQVADTLSSERLDDLKTDIAAMMIELSTLNTMANRWKGGFIMIVALGGIIGWILTSWESISVIFRPKM